MSYFVLGEIILLTFTLIFYLVFFGLMYYWHEKNISYIVPPLLFTFEFFLTLFLVVAVISIALEYYPTALEIFSSFNTQ